MAGGEVAIDGAACRKSPEMKVAIVGARGLVGSELMRQLSTTCDVLALGHEELDVRNRDRVEQVLTRARPALIFNCAVVGVDACQINPKLADQVNLGGARNLAEAASAINADLVHFSSNYIFDGTRETGSYSIDDAPCPVNLYGLTKLAGERAVVAANARSFIVRTSWVFGRGKENFLSALPYRLRCNEPVRAITDVFASPTFVVDLVTRVREIIATQRYGTYHVVNSGVCTFADFGFEVARVLAMQQSAAAGLVEKIKVQDAQLAALRPRYTPMFCKLSAELGFAPMRDWRSALGEYIRSLFGSTLG